MWEALFAIFTVEIRHTEKIFLSMLSLVMKDDDTRRLLNAKVTTNKKRHAALIELLYPTIYKFSCLLNLRFFPFDVQVGFMSYVRFQSALSQFSSTLPCFPSQLCNMTFSSWTYDQMGIDYFPYSHKIGTTNYIENEGWYILDTRGCSLFLNLVATETTYSWT